MKWGRVSKNCTKSQNTHKSELSGPLGQVLLTFLAFCGILMPASAFAAVEITHVTYDPPGSDVGHEWVEITNKGSESVNVATYRFREGGVNHKLTLASGTSTLPVGASAIIASDPGTYANDYPNNTESVFKSSFSLSNTGETLALVNASGTVEYTMSYTAPPKAATPPPAKKAPAKSTTTSSSKIKIASSSSATAAQATTYPNDTASVAGFAKTIPPMVGYAAGLAAIIALGIAGVLYARMNNGSLAAEHGTSALDEKFEIVEN